MLLGENVSDLLRLHTTIFQFDSCIEDSLLPLEGHVAHPVNIGQFAESVPDIDDMKGCAHEFQLPLHIIQERQLSGFYYSDMTVSKWGKPILAPNRGDTKEGNRKEAGDVAFITEYWMGTFSFMVCTTTS